eukprot:492889-Amphidinium_carterae.1
MQYTTVMIQSETRTLLGRKRQIMTWKAKLLVHARPRFSCIALQISLARMNTAATQVLTMHLPLCGNLHTT